MIPEKRRERIIFVSHTSSVSGAEMVMLKLAGLAVADGHSVVIASPVGAITEHLPDGATHLPLPPLGLAGGSGARRLFGIAQLGTRWVRAGTVLGRHARGSSARVVVNSLFALPAARVARLADGCTWLVHDTIVESKQRRIIQLSSTTIRRAVAVSSATAEPLRSYGFPVEVHYNGVPVDAEPVPVVHPGRPTVGVLAKLTPWKGHIALLEAMARVPEVDLEIAGDAFPGEQDYVAELHRLAELPDLRGRVRFLGRANSSDCLKRWTALISPSIRPEAGPLGVLEAMSAGCPVIGTDHGGTAEYLSGGVGVLVEPKSVPALADAIRRVVADAERRSQMAQLGRERVAHSHDITATAPAMLEALVGD